MTGDQATDTAVPEVGDQPEFDDDTLVQLGKIANTASWQTPKYSTYSLFGEERDRLLRLNDIAVGRALVEQLREAGLSI